MARPKRSEKTNKFDRAVNQRIDAYFSEHPELSKKQVAESLGIAYQTFENYTKETTPSISVLAGIASELNVSADYLLGLTDSPAPIKNPVSSSKRRQTTSRLSSLVEKYIDPNNDPRVYWAKEVTFDYSTNHKIRVDYMKFKPANNTVSGIEKGDFYCYEVKSSVEDFESRHGHNFIGDYNYYVMPIEVYEIVQQKIPWDVGVLAEIRSGEKSELESVKKARRRDRTRPVSEMLLMMFRSGHKRGRETNFLTSQEEGII